ncbi:Jasmonic acid-amido synthetase JAR1 [Glycine max]|nr:Jasmonic acid-amido synthetase JAR1 [Glycine max]
MQERVQRETLKRILEDNASAEYLQSLGLNGRTDPESFKACVPMVTHKELEPYIYRIIDGDASPILTGKPITTMSLSSGTTQGKPKYVPWNDELYETTMQIYQTSFAFRNRELGLLPPLDAPHHLRKHEWGPYREDHFDQTDFYTIKNL